MINDDYLLKWLVKANNDLTVAENEMKVKGRNFVTEAVCFHSQQAVEKFLKSFLVALKKDFKKTHNIEYLLELCSKIDKSFSRLDASKLSYYGVEVRYPDEFYKPNRTDARQSLAKARKVKRFVLAKLGTKSI